MTTLALGRIALSYSVPRVHHGWFLHDKTILLQSGNIATGVGKRNFINFIGVQPNFTLAAFEDGGREALLELK
jgi:hypothetical protein